MAADQLGQDGQLAAGDLDARQLGPTLEAEGDLAQRRGVDLLDGDVVEQRDGLGAHADEVVDVHRDAVDADRVEPAQRCSARISFEPTPSVQRASPRPGAISSTAA